MALVTTDRLLVNSGKCYRKGSGLKLLLRENLPAANSLQTKRCVHVQTKTKDLIRPFKDIPGPFLPLSKKTLNFLPVIGTYHNAVSLGLMEKFRAKYGDIVRFSTSHKRRPVVYVFNPDLMEQIYRSDEEKPVRCKNGSLTYFRENVKMDYFCGRNGLASSNDIDWKKHRALISSILLHPSTMEHHTQILDQVADDMCQRLNHLKQQEDNTNIAIETEIRKWALEAIGAIVLGSRLGCLDNELDQSSLAYRLVKCSSEISDLALLNKLRPSMWNSTPSSELDRVTTLYDSQLRICREYINEATRCLGESRRVGEVRRPVLQKLYELDPKLAVVTASDLLLAGVDAVTYTCIAAMYHLATNPAKQEQLHDDLKFDAGRSYVRACLKETMRLFPVTGGVVRRTATDVVLAGYHIPEGVNIVLGHHLASLDRAQYSRPTAFIPERWLVAKNHALYHGHAHTIATAPYGFGPASCIGKYVADQLLESLLANIFTRYQVTWTGPEAEFTIKTLNCIKSPNYFQFKKI